VREQVVRDQIDFLRKRLAFAALHIHPFLVAALFRQGDWRFAVVNYGYLLLATAAIGLTPRPLRRAVALQLYAVALWLNTTLVRPTPVSPRCSLPPSIEGYPVRYGRIKKER
jgi:hypothetical protein